MRGNRQRELQELVNLARVIALPGPPTTAELLKDEWQLNRLMRAWEEERARVRTPARRLIAASAMVAAAALVALIAWGMREAQVPPLSHQVAHLDDGKGVTEDRYVFSEGSVVTAASGTSLEVVEQDPKTPKVRVTRGRAFAQIQHHAPTKWAFLAGPFEVQVVGTSFDLGWNPEEQSMSLVMKEGLVSLRGPLVERGMRVQAGQRVYASLLTGLVRISSAPETAPSSAVTAPETVSAVPATPLPALVPKAMAASPAAGLANAPRSSVTSWRAWVARGHFDQVIAHARSFPLDECLTRCPADDLRALGDAARYSNQLDLADRAYRALYRRSAGKEDGQAASFLLGRTCEARGRWGEAKTWYGRYLAEAPSGEFATEASAGIARANRPR